MGDFVSNLSLGFGVALTPLNLGLAFLGCLVGTLVGVLPGVGPIATIAMLLPITFGLDPTGALIMLAGIYYGAQYGGSTTAILVNIPGEATSVVTALDGHQMARQGRAGVALGVAAIGSFFAGTVATLVIAALGAPLTRLALVFGPTEYFSLMIMGLVFAVVLARGSILKAIAMILVGVLLSTVGTDLETGEERMTFGLPFLSDGIDFAVLAMGIFGIAEIMRNLDHTETRDVVRQAIGRPAAQPGGFPAILQPVLRGTVIGAILGILPGNGAVLGPFASYTLEKKLAKDPRRFGRGAIEGVAGPESANNAGAQTSFIPLLTLGIPPNAVMALMVGAMTIHGIVPGPQVMTKNPNLFWGMIASMWVGNLMLLIINLPLIGLWVRLPEGALPADVPGDPDVLLHRHLLDEQRHHGRDGIGVFGLIGYALHQVRLRAGAAAARLRARQADGGEPAPALIISRGDMMTFIERPISPGCCSWRWRSW
jgi:putative tricarboxylic transport membrane protein